MQPRMQWKALLGSALIWLAPIQSATADWEVSGYLDLELRHFLDSPLSAEQHDSSLSLGVEPEFYRQWADGQQALTVVPFARIDQHDKERNHWDFRELNWLYVGDAWVLRAGLGKVFWGVTESQHLVDVINQTDTLEGTDGEDKLGQPMLNLNLIRDWGDLELYALPGFRERTFAGVEGRPRTPLVVDTDRARYESGAEANHVDLAMRWSRTLGDLDLALSHFHGTNREPELLLGSNARGEPLLIPFYNQIDQTGLELQLVAGDWLWKLEALRREGRNAAGDEETFSAAVGGFEYTLVGLLETDMDLGMLLEYHFDDRKGNASSGLDNDTFLGLRLTLNDAQSSELLAGIIVDNDTQAQLAFLEASRRLGDRYTLSLEGRFFSHLAPQEPLFGLRNDDHLQLSLNRYF